MYRFMVRIVYSFLCTSELIESRGRGCSRVKGRLGHHRDGRATGRDSDVGDRRKMPGIRDTGNLLFHAGRAVRTIPAAEPGSGVAITTICSS